MASKFTENPVAQVRLASRKTGEDFAASISLSVGSIRNMERGRLLPGKETRDRIFICYGVDTDSLLNAKGTALYARGKVPYTWESYQDWKNLTKVDDKKAEELIHEQVERVRWLLKAAAQNGSFFSTLFLLETKVQPLAEDAGLKGLIHTVMRQEGSQDNWVRLDSGILCVIDHVIEKLGPLPADEPQASAPDSPEPPKVTISG